MSIFSCNLGVGKAGVEERSDQTLCPADFTPITTYGVHKPCGEKPTKKFYRIKIVGMREFLCGLNQMLNLVEHCGSSEGTCSES